MEWIPFKIIPYSPFRTFDAPYDGCPFLAVLWGNSVRIAIYARHYDAEGRIPGKYEFFYVTDNPENEGWQIKVEECAFPITHWMPLPDPPKE